MNEAYNYLTLYSIKFLEKCKEEIDMPREKEGYRLILADILEYTNGRRELSLSEVCRYLGKDRRHVQKKYGIKPGGIVATELARKLCID